MRAFVSWLSSVLVCVSVCGAAQPVTVTARDVSLKVNGGKDYTMFHGRTANQFERDMMEGTLLSIYMPQIGAYLRSMPACRNYLNNYWSQMPVILRRLDVVHQYRGAVLDGGTWNVTPGGRHYQIEGYQMAHARDCSLGSTGKAACAANPLMTPDMLDLLDMRIEDGVCVKGATFEPYPEEDYQSSLSKPALLDGEMLFPILDADSEAALETAESAHMAGMCGMDPSPISVRDAQNAFIALAFDESEAHFRTPPPFKGGCDPAWTAVECCRWKELEHREYTAWAAAVRIGRWGEADCFGGRHKRVHFCANLYPPPDVKMIRMPPCTFGEYPDDTEPVSCQDYLENPVP